MDNRSIQYQSRINNYTEELIKRKKDSQKTAWARAFAFVLMFFFFIWFFKTNIYYSIAFSLPLLVLFLILIKTSSRIKYRIHYLEELIKINQQELKALDHDFQTFPDGKEYVDYDHGFSYDLDIFGKASLFQYINRTCTQLGKDQLNEYFRNPDTDINTLVEKQKSIRELSEMLDWRQEFLARGNIMGIEQENKDELNVWLEQKKLFQQKIYAYAFPVFGLIGILNTILMVTGVLSPYFLIYFLIPYGLTGIHIKTINKRHGELEQKIKLLKKFTGLFGMIENANFQSILLKQKQNILLNEGRKVSQKIKKLVDWLNYLDSRSNMIANLILNSYFLWDIYFLHKVERWKSQNKKYFPDWCLTLASMDAFMSLANYTYNVPNYVFPSFASDYFTLKIKQGGHPLIPGNQLVRNDFIVDSPGKISIITGANMAGKSTFLRSTGVNMILGMLACPVCAEEMHFTPVKLLTSVRTNDSLNDNESYFYAELKRLQSIIQKINTGERIFVIVDEMLRGTNSKDKHSGSIGLVKQFVDKKTSGLVATHDVALGKLMDEYPDRIQNKRFEVEIKGDKLIFDYKLLDGISQNLNATFLMKKMEIL